MAAIRTCERSISDSTKTSKEYRKRDDVVESEAPSLATIQPFVQPEFR
jgi:hypothetical protein